MQTDGYLRCHYATVQARLHSACYHFTRGKNLGRNLILYYLNGIQDSQQRHNARASYKFVHQQKKTVSIYEKKTSGIYKVNVIA